MRHLVNLLMDVKMASGAIGRSVLVGVAVLGYVAACGPDRAVVPAEAIGTSERSSEVGDRLTVTPAPTGTPTPLGTPTPSGTPTPIRTTHNTVFPCWSSYRAAERLIVEQVQWISDGGQIVFNVSGRIYGVAPDGTKLRMVADARPPLADWLVGYRGQGTGTHFDISTAEPRLVYISCEFGYPESTGNEIDEFIPEIATRSLAGDDRRQVTFNREGGYFPSWSPDGSRIAFLDDGLDDGLYSMAPDGSSRLEHETGLDKVWLVTPQWSPDGTRIAVVGAATPYKGGPLTMVVVGADGGAPMVLTQTSSAPSWSPDGERLAFARRDWDSGVAALYTIAADGSDLERVTTIDELGVWSPPYDHRLPTLSGGIRMVEWSPSGEHIAYACGRHVCVVDVHGTPVGRSPLAVGAYTASWSPDGSRLAVGRLEMADPDPDQINSPSIYIDMVGVVLYTMAPDGSDVRPMVLDNWDGTFRGARVRRSPDSTDVAGCTTGAAVPDPAVNPGLVSDCEVLLALRDRLAGSIELNWTTDRPIDEWDGVWVYGSPPRVTKLHFPQPGLSGVLPAELGELSELSSIWLAGNYLHGPIPSELGNLTNLTRLELQLNLLTGEIPESLAQLSNLEILNVSNNFLSGQIPRTLAQLANLEVLILSNNHLSGQIPRTLAQLANLEVLDVSNNYLSGQIPRMLAQLANLQVLAVSINRLSGQIPEEIAQLRNLKDVYLSENEFTGCLPNMLVSDYEFFRLKGFKFCKRQE